MDIASVELPPDEDEPPQEVGPNARFNFSSPEEGESTASRLAECAKENARLSRHLQDLQKSAERVKNLEAKCKELQDELQKMAVVLADKKREINSYKSCEFKPKERTSVLTLLWALATELGVKLDTSTKINRLNNLEKVRTAVQQIACNLDDKTIRKYLKEAAEMVEENKIT